MLHDLIGDDAAADVEADTLDSCLKQKILEEFKSDKITLVADHNHAESVSIMTDTKFRNQAFWNVPTQAQAQFVINYMQDSDYATLPRDAENTDRILQHFYQHIYVGPHELVNIIHRYLLSLDAHGRAGFIGLVCTALTKIRPFANLEEDRIDYRDLVKERYCEIIPITQEAIKAATDAAYAAAIANQEDADAAAERAGAVAAEPDYIFTRKGIEMILFYTGYLAWNGAAGAHPLRADWNENLRWLYNIDRKEEDDDAVEEVNRHKKYRAIYDAPPPA